MMKDALFLMCFVLACAPACAETNVCTLANVESRGRSLLLLGWFGMNFDKVTVERYEDAKAAGLDVMMQRVKSVDEAVAALDMAKKAGIRLMIDCQNAWREDPAGFAKRVCSHPAFAIYHLCDEPMAGGFGDLARMTAAIRKVDEVHPCNVNLFGRITEEGATESEFLGAPTFDDYLERSLSVPTQVLSFDMYPIRTLKLMENEPFRPVYAGCDIRTNWYHTLETYRTVSRRTRRPFWGFALVTAHNHYGRTYPIPTLGHLRLQMYSNLAYGAQGLQYFYYGYPHAQATMHGTPIDDAGLRAASHDRIRLMNRELRAREDVFAGCESADVFHAGSVPMGCRGLRPEDLPPWVKKLSAPDGEALVARLVNGKREYIVIVNRNPERELTLKISVAKGTRRVLDDGNRVDAMRYGGEFWLDPGSAEIFEAPCGDARK